MYRFVLLLLTILIVGCNDGDDTNNSTLNNNSNNITENNSSNTNNSSGLMGELQISFTTVSNNGQYAPRNCAAVWLLKEDGSYIKTIKLYGYHYDYYLFRWKGDYDSTDADAVTSATRTGHGTINLTWDLKDYTGSNILPGVYEVWFEFTENNGQGPYAFESITLDGSEMSYTGTDSNNFSSISINYLP
ncbi:MAG: DUF2271 domain-containing protein [Deltaproteobacteria bacterium]|nr:DUF2271 domain-containing protein [Deltaproteobacteria bacterium]